MVNIQMKDTSDLSVVTISTGDVDLYETVAVLCKRPSESSPNRTSPRSIHNCNIDRS